MLLGVEEVRHDRAWKGAVLLEKGRREVEYLDHRILRGEGDSAVDDVVDFTKWVVGTGTARKDLEQQDPHLRLCPAQLPQDGEDAVDGIVGGVIIRIVGPDHEHAESRAQSIRLP